MHKAVFANLCTHAVEIVFTKLLGFLCFGLMCPTKVCDQLVKILFSLHLAKFKKMFFTFSYEFNDNVISRAICSL